MVLDVIIKCEYGKLKVSLFDGQLQCLQMIIGAGCDDVVKILQTQS